MPKTLKISCTTLYSGFLKRLYRCLNDTAGDLQSVTAGVTWDENRENNSFMGTLKLTHSPRSTTDRPMHDRSLLSVQIASELSPVMRAPNLESTARAPGEGAGRGSSPPRKAIALDQLKVVLKQFVVMQKQK